MSNSDGNQGFINGRINKRHLAEIFQRAEALLAKDPNRKALLDSRRSTRLGKALIKELLNRAVISDEADPPLLDERLAQRRPAQRRPAQRRPAQKPPPQPAPQKKVKKKKKARTLLEFMQVQEDQAADPGTPAVQGSALEAARAAAEKAEAEAREAEAAAARAEAEAEIARWDAQQMASGDPDATSTHVDDVEVPGQAFPAMDEDEEVDGGDTSFLSLSELTKSLTAATQKHLDDNAAMRTFIEDIEMPDPEEARAKQQHIERVQVAAEISFEGYLEDIEKLLVESYEHYKNVPEAFGPSPVDPNASDILGPGGETLESRRAARRDPPSRPAVSAPSGPPVRQARPTASAFLPGQEGFHEADTQRVLVPPQPSPTQTPATAAPDPFAVDPYGGAAAGPPAMPGHGPSPAPVAQPPGAGGGGSVDPFSLDPFTGKPLEAVDPFKLDPFAPFTGGASPPPPGPGPVSAPFGQQPVAPAMPAAGPWGSGGFPAPGGQAQLPPSQPATPAETSFGVGDPGESQMNDPYAWPSAPPPALSEAQRRAAEAAKEFDPFGDSGEFGPPPGAPAAPASPFGPGMFGQFSQGPPGPRPGGQAMGPGGLAPIYVNDSDELVPDAGLGPKEAKRAFENALVMAGLRGMLEYQRPEPGHGSSHPVMLIFDPVRKVFKAPLTPRISIGDRFQLRDGRIFRVQACSVFEVQGVPCYQEAVARPLGQMRMPLRDSWEGFAPPAP